jgi:hypothetical protein
MNYSLSISYYATAGNTSKSLQSTGETWDVLLSRNHLVVNFKVVSLESSRVTVKIIEESRK